MHCDVEQIRVVRHRIDNQGVTQILIVQYGAENARQRRIASGFGKIRGVGGQQARLGNHYTVATIYTVKHLLGQTQQTGVTAAERHNGRIYQARVVHNGSNQHGVTRILIGQHIHKSTRGEGIASRFAQIRGIGRQQRSHREHQTVATIHPRQQLLLRAHIPRIATRQLNHRRVDQIGVKLHNHDHRGIAPECVLQHYGEHTGGAGVAGCRVDGGCVGGCQYNGADHQAVAAVLIGQQVVGDARAVRVAG